jgi:hypothetical protein
LETQRSLGLLDFVFKCGTRWEAVSNYLRDHPWIIVSRKIWLDNGNVRSSSKYQWSTSVKHGCPTADGRRASHSSTPEDFRPFTTQYYTLPESARRTMCRGWAAACNRS